jgi:nucleoside-diphosphate-sugar epimerase
MGADEQYVLVTGGTGFVGSHVVDALLDEGYKVRCTVRGTSNLRWLEGKSVELIEADLRGGDLAEAVTGVEAVVHCAGLTRGSTEALFAANCDGTRVLLDACERADRDVRFVFCSSQAAAGPGTLGRPRELGDPPAPTSDYGRSKLAGEEEVLKRSGRLQVSVLRPVGVYGPRDEDTLPYFQMAKRGVIVVPGVRERRVQLVHARDVATALLAGLRRPEAVGRTFFVGHPEILSWDRLTAAIGEAIGRRPMRIRVPSAALLSVGAIAELVGSGKRSGQIDRRRAQDMAERAWTCNVEATLTELEWEPEYDALSGFRDTAEWYRGEGWL